MSDITHPKQEVALISSVTVPSEGWKNLSNCKRKRIRWWRSDRNRGWKRWRRSGVVSELVPPLIRVSSHHRGKKRHTSTEETLQNCCSFYKTCRRVNATGCFPPTLHSSDICLSFKLGFMWLREDESVFNLQSVRMRRFRVQPVKRIKSLPLLVQDLWWDSGGKPRGRVLFFFSFFSFLSNFLQECPDLRKVV